MATQNYDSVDMNEMLQESQRFGKKENALDKFVMFPREGAITVRILPPAVGKKLFCATRIHKLMIGERIWNLHCTRVLKMINGTKRWLDEDIKDPCPICKYNQELWNQVNALEKAGDKAAAEVIKDQAGKVKANERYYYNAIIRSMVNKNGDVEKNVGPKILSIPKTLHQLVIVAYVGDVATEEKALGDIADPKTGRDFKIMVKPKAGKIPYPEYAGSKFLDPTVLGDKEHITKWLNELHPLAELRRLRPHAEMKLSLDKYLGKVPLDDTSFDYQSSEDHVERASSAMPTVKSPIIAEIEKEMGGSGNDDETISDAEFLKELGKY